MFGRFAYGMHMQCDGRVHFITQPYWQFQWGLGACFEGSDCLTYVENWREKDRKKGVGVVAAQYVFVS